MFKHHNPFKTLYTVLLLIGVGAGIILVVFAFSWLADNIYTLIWIFLVLGCLIWLADSIYMTIQQRISQSNDKTQFPSETFED
jgi:c-di-AMP phosphodiesterase-like protein